MHKNLKWLLLAPVAMGFVLPLTAQTTPAAVSLPFSLTSQTSATLPAGVAIHRFASLLTTRTLAPGTADLPAVSNVPTGTAGGWYYLGNDGIGMLAAATVPAGALVVAINTTGQSNINISWVCRTINNLAARDNSVALQYRIGTSGNFTNLGTVTTYTSTGKANGHVSAPFTEVLPVIAENQPVVQLRWIYWESTSSAGQRDNIAVDEIAINTSAGPACNYPPVATGAVTDSTAGFVWNSVATATAYEYALSTNPAPPVSGATTTDTVFTGTGLSNHTTYYFHVRTHCTGGAVSNWITDTARTTGPACNPPVVSAGGVTDSTAVFTWNNVGSALSYEYVLSTSPTPPASGTVTTDTSYSATGLGPATTYYLHVRSNCGAIKSAWTTDDITTTGVSPEFTVMTYNLLNYPGSTAAIREPKYRTIVNAAQPDIVVVQELSSGSGVNSFLNNVLNFSASTYSAGAFIDGPDSDNGIFYKPALFQFISNTAISTTLRNISQFKLRQLSSGDTLIIYSVHLKASNTAPDEAQRAAEVANLRAVTNALPTGRNFMVCGDFNIYRSSEAAYQGLVQNGSNADGKFNDILSMSGTWNSTSYAPYHTQSPRTTSFGGGATGGMDDRFDMFLFSDKIIQSGGFDIIGGSYKAFGNDGQHFNQALNTPPYVMYDATLCAALHDASDHLPVVVKMKHAPGPVSGPFDLNTAAAANDGSINSLFTVYPNPAHDQFFLKVNYTTTTPLSLYLYDLNGRVLKTITVENQSAGTIIPVDVSRLPGGVFYFRAPALDGACKVVKY